ncbi:glycosyltransferase family protein [Glycomyces dulcitolivorans]|uniref:glycosyltransferase family protein n=1 Tax=Glycomyces dulcitolivorans TaxID=2200759 RepID=UPI0038CBF6DF
MRIGYSHWGFLGPGVTDTPDGGRSHRKPLIDALLERGHEVVFLQQDRDRLEAGDDLDGRYRFDPTGFPDIDVLVCEWRWPIPGRNTTPCGSTGHTCDLHRQDELFTHYVGGEVAPMVLWDKDRNLSASAPLRSEPGVAVCEAALLPTEGAHQLLFPVDDGWIDRTDPAQLAELVRPLTLAYVGNQYGRDNAFTEFFAPAAAQATHVVAGKWPDTALWSGVNFAGRIAYGQVEELYRSSLATVLLLPDRYAAAAQMTQRIFEAALAGCLPLAPSTIAKVESFVPTELVVADGRDVIERLRWLRSIAGTEQHVELIRACAERIRGVFNLATQVEALESAIEASRATFGMRRRR